MSDVPLVSVIMPVHNGEKYLRQALRSALDQRYPNVEIIVVDDGSTDATQEILREFGARLTQIRQDNAGAAVARNTALRAARGEFLAFLDADDLWFRNKLKLQVDYLLGHPDIDLVASRWRVLQEEGSGSPFEVDPSSASVDTPLEIDAATSGWLYHELLIDCVIHTTTVVLRRRLIDKIGMFDADLRRGQDYDYWLRASRATEIHTLATELSCYRLHATNSTWRPQRSNYGAIVLERALRAWGRKGPDGRAASLVRVRRRLAQLWSNFGYQHLTNGSVATALHAALRGLIAWPLYSKPWRLLAACAAAPLRAK